MKDKRLERACLSLDGLSTGDAFGQLFFSANIAVEAGPDRLPPPPWPYTDDTEMAVALTETLRECGQIDRDDFASRLTKRYCDDPNRGYGPGARRLLEDIAAGGNWETLSRAMFGGSGSYGNGAAMRSAPLGAWFADDEAQIAPQAQLSAEVTHSHAEGQVGAVAVALAAAWAWQSGGDRAEEMIPWVIAKIDQSEVRRRLEWLVTYPLDTWPYTIASQVGSGHQISAQDTVPFCIWMAAAYLNDYSGAMWASARVGGDMDTTCAIIGGIVAMNVGRSGIPDEWMLCREPLAWSRDRS